MRLGHYGEVLARRHRMQVSGCRAPAPAVFLRHLKEPAAQLHGAVEIRIERQAGLLRGLDEEMAERIRIGTLGDIERTVVAVKAVVQVLVALGPLEVRQHIVVAPAGIAELPPMIVVSRLAAHIDHGIDRARAANETAARPIHAPAFHRRLRRGFVTPVETRTGQVGDAGRHAHIERIVGTAGLEQQHPDLGARRQPVGQDRAGRPRSDNDVVVFRFRHLVLTSLNNYVIVVRLRKALNSMRRSILPKGRVGTRKPER
jgi:hypothetical protein